MSKGSKRRPGKGYEERYDSIFKKAERCVECGNTAPSAECPFCDERYKEEKKNENV